jgi:hypothetical protein
VTGGINDATAGIHCWGNSRIATDGALAQQIVVTAFATRLRELGWKAGENVWIDYRWGGGDTTRMTLLAEEL